MNREKFREGDENELDPKEEDYQKKWSDKELKEKGKIFTGHIFAEIAKKSNGNLTPSDIQRKLDELFGVDEENFSVASRVYLEHR